uniref:Uncharacterized protein n=1 Tax=Lepeophtheirus salmonis TaxID=72036 RepID=A0A0K2VDB5_LEPSM
MPSSWKKSFLRHLLLLALRFTFVTMSKFLFNFLSFYTSLSEYKTHSILYS